MPPEIDHRQSDSRYRAWIAEYGLEVAIYIAVLKRALPLVGFAADIPNRALEAEQWLADVRAELSGASDEKDQSHGNA